MALQSDSVREIALGEEAAVVFTVLVVLWLTSRGELNPLSLVFVYLTAVALTGLYFGVQSLTQK
jgi:hypothetical protein